MAELGVKAEPISTLSPEHVGPPGDLPEPSLKAFKQTPVCSSFYLSVRRGTDCFSACFTAEKGFYTVQSLTAHTLLIPALI